MIREYDPQLSGRLPEAFSGAGNDVVLLGHPCGRGDVLDWVRQFRALPRFPPIVVIGNGDERQIVAALKAGANEYVGKPGLSHSRLAEAIEEATKAPARAVQNGSGALEPVVAGVCEPIPRNYEIIRKLASGEIATVYLARQRNADRQLVLKVLHQVADSAAGKILDRFLREYELIARIDHPNVVRIYDFGVADDHAYIAMEYCGGGSLKRRITAGMDSYEAYRLMRDIAGALGVLHSANILHRDLKPTNVLFRDDGSLALIDFGLAKQVALKAEVTGAGAIFGTPYYMSPEQGHGEPVDLRGDIYSLGVIFFEMLTGTKPYDGDTAMAVIVKHRQAPVPRLPTSLREFQPLIQRMLAKQPAGRFQSVEELLDWQPAA
ncbi:MAG: protein kinase [Gammaproteobacteria bacterium]|nr:protein kinase [Gammaproteobacteria bacterium]